MVRREVGGSLEALSAIVERDNSELSQCNGKMPLLIAYATATQRAEAFLRTIGKWEGGAKT